MGKRLGVGLFDQFCLKMRPSLRSTFALSDRHRHGQGIGLRASSSTLPLKLHLNSVFAFFFLVFGCNKQGFENQHSQSSVDVSENSEIVQPQSLLAVPLDAQVITYSGIPQLMLPGTTATVSIVMKNTGTTVWTAKNNFRLGSMNPLNNTVWGPKRILLTNTEKIAAGQNKTFTFKIVAPKTPGTYNFQWQMIREGVQWFGSQTPNLKILVSAAPVDANYSSKTKIMMEYEAWFGPKASNFSTGPGILPILSSPNMVARGGGYDSRDELVIDQHYRWLLQMGVDSIVLDHTNAIACSFFPSNFNKDIPAVIVDKYIQNGRQFPLEYKAYLGLYNWLPVLESYPKNTAGDQQLLATLQDYLNCRPGDGMQVAMMNIKNNNENLFRLWDLMGRKYGKFLKIVVLAGGYETTAWEPLASQGGVSAMDLQIKFYGDLYKKYPSLALFHEGKPLLLSYFAAPTATFLYPQFDSALNKPSWIDFTLRKMGGFMSNQQGIAGYLGLGKLNLPRFRDTWTWIDRLNESPPAILTGPSYSEAVSGKVEAFTVTMANPAPNGWGDFANKIPTQSGSLRRNGDTFREFMSLARGLIPQFLIINQFNEFASGDQGWNEETTNDIEPTNLWGTKYLDLTTLEISKYRNEEQSPTPHEVLGVFDSAVRLPSGEVNITGWACMFGLGQSIAVHLYAGGPVGVGQMIGGYTANQLNEPQVDQACGTLFHYHRFRVTLDMGTATLYSGKPIFIYGISTLGLINQSLAGSGSIMLP